MRDIEIVIGADLHCPFQTKEFETKSLGGRVADESQLFCSKMNKRRLFFFFFIADDLRNCPLVEGISIKKSHIFKTIMGSFTCFLHNIKHY